jgi:hypothetical protein
VALKHLFDAELQYQQGIAPLAEEGEGVLVGSGDGTVAGPALTGLSGGHSSSSLASSSAR